MQISYEKPKNQKQLLPIMNNAGTFTRVPGGCLRWPPTPPGPRWPPALFLELERERTKEEKEREEVLHLFRCYTHTHTRDPRRRQTKHCRSQHKNQGRLFQLIRILQRKINASDKQSCHQPQLLTFQKTTFVVSKF